MTTAYLGGLFAQIAGGVGAPGPPSPPPPGPPPPPPPPFVLLDTPMTFNGIVRQGGPSTWSGFTCQAGTGTVQVYRQRTATGTPIQTVVNPTIGVFQSITPVEGGAFYVSRTGMTISCRVDD